MDHAKEDLLGAELEASCALDAIALAPRLLGCRLACRATVDGECRWREGRIVEVEAYPGGPDRASHTFGGRRTARNASMWRRGGHAYVYFVYGMHHCVNVVSGPEGSGEAVLIRALEPGPGFSSVERESRTCCRGPARLTKALGIDRRLDGAWLLGRGQLRLLPPKPEEGATTPTTQVTVVTGPRIGIDYAGVWARRHWRFWIGASTPASRLNESPSISR